MKIYSYKFNNSFCTPFTSANTSCVDKQEIEKEEQRLIEYYFHNLPTMERMSSKDINKLKNSLLKTNQIKDFIMMSLGIKPAALIFMDNSCNISDIQSKDFDILETNDRYNNVFIFNKKETLRNISKNKDFITQKLEIPSNINNEKIYDILISTNSPINTTDQNFKKNHDLIGLILGFPIENSVIFQLENMTNLNDEEKTNIPKLKSEIKKVFLTSNIYENFDNKFKSNTLQVINNIDRREISDKEDITCIKYFKENNNDKSIRLEKYLQRLEERNKLGVQRSLHTENCSTNCNITDDYYNYILMFEND